MTIPKISFSNIVSLLFSLTIAVTLLYYGHEGLEKELAREHRDWYVMAFYGGVVVIGLLVAPSIRDRVIPAAKAGFTLISLGRRATDPKVIAAVPEIELPPKAEVKP